MEGLVKYVYLNFWLENQRQGKNKKKKFLKTKTEFPNKLKYENMLNFRGREKEKNMLSKIMSYRNIK